MLKPQTYQTPNAIDPGEAPPSRPSRRISTGAGTAVPSVQDVRLNAARLLQDNTSTSATSATSTSGMNTSTSPSSSSNRRCQTFPYNDAEDRRYGNGNGNDDDDEYDDEYGHHTHIPTNDNGSSLPSVEEARLYAGRILNNSTVEHERTRLTMMSSFNVEAGNGNGSSRNNRNRNNRSSFNGVPLVMPSATQQQQRKRKRYCLYATLAMAFLAIIIGLSIHIASSTATSNNNNSNNSLNTPQQAPPPPTSTSTTISSQRLLETRTFLQTNNISSQTHIEMDGSAQGLAAVWMADRDALQYTIPTTLSTDAKLYQSFIQRYVLAVLYFSTHGTGWTNQNLFLDKQHECAWFTPDPLTDGDVVALGVICDNNLDVEGLLMPRNNLAGTLPTELSHLTKLNFIDLNRNALRGPAIPDEFVQLTRMTFYDLRYNSQLTGTIPLWIGTQWSQLTELALADNQMGGTLPASMMGLQHLKSLALGDNDFEDGVYDDDDKSDTTTTSSILTSLTALEFLYLERNKFKMVVDDSFLAGMDNLIQVDISSNRLTGTDLPLHLFQHSKLQVLDLSDNNIMGQLPTFAGSSSGSSGMDDRATTTTSPINTALQYFAISDNILTGSLPPSMLHQLSVNLHHLDVTGNDLSGPIPDSLADMPKLTYLFLSENGFNQGPIPNFIPNRMHQLRELSLSSTQRTGVLPPTLNALSNLILFDVSYNQMEGTIPAVLWQLPKLAYLLLNRNSLTGTLPTGVVANANYAPLKMMLLDKNDIQGDLTDVCTTVAKQTALKTIIADCDDIAGCTCCQCCSDSELRCNDDILYTNMDFSWEHNYTRTSYAFSPAILFESV